MFWCSPEATLLHTKVPQKTSSLYYIRTNMWYFIWKNLFFFQLYSPNLSLSHSNSVYSTNQEDQLILFLDISQNQSLLSITTTFAPVKTSSSFDWTKLMQSSPNRPHIFSLFSVWGDLPKRCYLQSASNSWMAFQCLGTCSSLLVRHTRLSIIYGPSHLCNLSTCMFSNYLPSVTPNCW